MDHERVHITYEMASTPPPMLRWEEFEARATADWRALLSSGDACHVDRICDFLVKHPSFVPGAGGLLRPSAFPPCHRALLARSPLCEWVHAQNRRRSVPGLQVPDFLWIAHTEDDLMPVLVRIGSACKRWFKESGAAEDEVLREIDCLRQWREYLSEPAAIISFHSTFNTPVPIRRHGEFRPECLLIYGRDDEFAGQPDLISRRAELREHGLIFLSFDALQADRDCENYICFSRRDELSTALSVPPTMRLGPSIAGAWHGVQGFPNAILANDWISPERRAFLIDRLPYWQRWAASAKRTPYRVNWDDWE